MTVDRTVPFGYKCSWLAVTASDAATAADALGLRRREPVTWARGVDLAYDRGVFVAPPIGEWVLVPGRDLPDVPEPGFLDRLAGWSARLGHVRFFHTHRVAGSCAWATASAGRVLRAYAFDGGDSTLFLGDVTEDEAALGVGAAPRSPDDEAWWETAPDEDDVMALAGRWSVDPTSIEGLETDGHGIAGRLRR